jgi:uncharacterized membrane protein YgcG
MTALLLLVAKDDRALRIEVGYGLEGALNDIDRQARDRRDHHAALSATVTSTAASRPACEQHDAR